VLSLMQSIIATVVMTPRYSTGHLYEKHLNH
jgi:hypothetical protein